MRTMTAALLLMSTSMVMAAEPYFPTEDAYAAEDTTSRYGQTSTADSQARFSTGPLDGPTDSADTRLLQFEIQVGTSKLRAEMLNNKYPQN